jgi:hypothetical protein
MFSHGWPVSADSWEAQMLFLASNGYRCIAHDHRGHGRSSQPWSGNEMDTYADDLSELIETLDLKGVVLNGTASELWAYVAMDAPVKFTVLKLRNVSGRPRRLSVTSYCEGVLGGFRHKSLLHVQTEVDLKTGMLLARNYYNTEFPDRIVFLDVNDATRTLTGDRKKFIGRNGSLS